jgi:hypothetical protein
MLDYILYPKSFKDRDMTEERKEEIWKRIAEGAVRNYEVGND